MVPFNNDSQSLQVQPELLDLFDTPAPAFAVYSRLFAEAGMFTPSDDSSGFVDRTYDIGGDIKIHHTGPELSLTDEESLIAMIQLTNTGYSESDQETRKFLEFHSERKRNIRSRQLLLEKASAEGDSGPDEAAFSYIDAELTLKGEISNYLINKYLDVSWGTKASLVREASVSRLENTILQVTKGNITRPKTHLLRTERDATKSSRYIVMFDLHLHMLIGQLMNIDLSLRNKLNSKGKCLQRLLTVEGFPQRKEPLAIQANEFRDYIGLPKETFRRIRNDLQSTRSDKTGDQGPLPIMKEHGFIRDYQFIPNEDRKKRRSNPFTLVIS